MPAQELSEFISDGLLEVIESIELNSDYLQNATDAQIKILLEQHVLKKTTRYKTKIEPENGAPSDLQKQLMDAGKIESSPHRVVVQRKRAGRKSRTQKTQ